MAEENQASGYVLPPAFAKLFEDGITAPPPAPVSGEVSIFGQSVDLVRNF
jgi:hypothetical protein